MIKDGYLELTTHLKLSDSGKENDAETLHLLREFSAKSSIKSLTFYSMRYGENANNFSIFVEVLKKNKKAERVHFEMDAIPGCFKIFWDTLVAVLLIKRIRYVRFNIIGSWVLDSDDIEMISDHPDVMLDHIDKIELKLDDDAIFHFYQSDELKMSDVAKTFQGVYSIREN